MMQKANFIPGLVHDLTFTNGFSYIRLLDEHAHILLNLRCSVPDHCIYINDQSETGAWGERSSIELPAEGTAERLRLHIKVENHLELWNSSRSARFERFTKEIAGKVRYCILHDAQNTNQCLVQKFTTVDEMSAELANQVAMRRIDQLEGQLKALLNTPAEA